MTDDMRETLEYLRGRLRSETISQGELIHLQSLAEHIEPGDVELLEAAGVPEFEEEAPTRFELTIELGNEAMQTAEDVARALRGAADYIAGTGGWEHIDAGSVRDDNGNTVGEWEAK